MTFKVCLKKKYRTLITETTCRENACLFRETKHTFKNLGPDNDVVCRVSSFGLALRKSEGGFIGCGSFHQSASVRCFVLGLREPDAAH